MKSRFIMNVILKFRKIDFNEKLEWEKKLFCEIFRLKKKKSVQ